MSLCLLSIWTYLNIVTKGYFTVDCPDESHVYGSEVTCEANLHICKYDWGKDYDAKATIQGITGPTTKRLKDRADARKQAVSLLFAQYRNLSCNCITEHTIIDDCDLRIETCFNFKSSADVDINKIEYEAYITHSNFTGHYCCDSDRNTSILIVTQYLMTKYPSCFTSNPTVDPTVHPTVDLKICEKCYQSKERCLSGYQRYIKNKDYCQPCPAGEAGHDGLCDPCKDGTEPTHDRRNCEETKTFLNSDLGIKIIAGIAVLLFGLISGAIATCLVNRCCPHQCKKISQSNHDHDLLSRSIEIPNLSGVESDEDAE